MTVTVVGMDWLVILLVILWVATFLLMVFFWRRSESALRKMESYLFGTRWHYISDFRHTYMQISNKSCYENFASKIKFTVFPLFCPLKRGFEVAFMDRRTSVVIKSGILSESRPYQKAHLIPHSVSCNASWKLVFEPLLWSFAKTNTLYPLNKLLDMMLYGFQDKNSNMKSANAGIIHNPFNIFALADQFQGLDLTCVLALVPFEIGGKPVTMESILSWNGEELTVLVLPHSIHIGKGYFGFIQVDGKYVSEIESDDPKVINSIDIFNEYSLMISGCIAHDILEVSTTENKGKLCNYYRKFIKTQKLMPCLQVPNKAGILKVQGFPSCKVTLPGRRNSSTRNLDFSAPHPFLLVLRGMNAWCDYLHRYQAWPEWTQHIQRIAKRLPDGDELLRARLVILPGCCDVSRYEPDCQVQLPHHQPRAIL